MPDDIEEHIEQSHQQAVQFYQQDRYQKAVDLAIGACDLARQQLGEEHLLFASSLGNLAEFPTLQRAVLQKRSEERDGREASLLAQLRPPFQTDWR
jgi:hypothetical protein